MQHHHRTGTDWMIAFEDPLMQESAVWEIETVPNPVNRASANLANFCVVAVTLVTVAIIASVCQSDPNTDKQKRSVMLLLSSVPTLLAFLTFVLVWQSCDVTVLHSCFAVVVGCYLAGFVFIWLSHAQEQVQVQEEEIVAIETEQAVPEINKATVQNVEVPDVPFFCSDDFGSVSCALAYEPNNCNSSVGP